MEERTCCVDVATHNYFEILSPIRGRNFIRYPIADQLRWLRTNTIDCFRQIVDTVDHHLCRMLWTTAVHIRILPYVHNFRTVKSNENIFDQHSRADIWWSALPNGTILRRSVSIPILPRAMDFPAIRTIDHRSAPRKSSQSNPRGFIRCLRCDSHHHLSAIQMASFTQIYFVLILILISTTLWVMVIFAIANVTHGQFAAFLTWHTLYEAREILLRERIERFLGDFAGEFQI